MYHPNVKLWSYVFNFLFQFQVTRVTFKYHMMLRGGEGLLKLSEYCHMGEGKLAKLSYNFYRGRKSLIHGSSCSIYSILGRVGWLKTSYGGRGLKLLKKPSSDI